MHMPSNARKQRKCQRQSRVVFGADTPHSRQSIHVLLPTTYTPCGRDVRKVALRHEGQQRAASARHCILIPLVQMFESLHHDETQNA